MPAAKRKNAGATFQLQKVDPNLWKSQKPPPRRHDQPHGRAKLGVQVHGHLSQSLQTCKIRPVIHTWSMINTNRLWPHGTAHEIAGEAGDVRGKSQLNNPAELGDSKEDIPHTKFLGGNFPKNHW